jgi:beta-glucosidase
VTFTLNEASLSYYDPAKKGWVAERGTFEVLIGSASDDIRVTGSFVLSSDVLNAVVSDQTRVG